MRQILLLLICLTLTKLSKSQCLLPYGKKTFTVLEERQFNGNKPSILVKSLYTDNTVEILKLDNNTSRKDMINLSGALLGGDSPMFIVGRNCTTLADKNILYTIYADDTRSTLTYYLTLDPYRNFVSLSFGQKGEKTFFVLK